MKNTRILALIGFICLQVTAVSVIQAFDYETMYTNIYNAVSNGQTEEAQTLLDQVPSGELTDLINRKSRDGRKLLHAAALSGNPSTVKLLLFRYAADANVTDFNGNTPLHLAASLKNVDVVKALINGGAKVKVQNSKGSTPLHNAAKSGSPEIVAALLDAGADASVEDTAGFTPVKIAQQAGRTAILKEFGKSRVVKVRPLEESAQWGLEQSQGT